MHIFLTRKEPTKKRFSSIPCWLLRICVLFVNWKKVISKLLSTFCALESLRFIFFLRPVLHGVGVMRLGQTRVDACNDVVLKSRHFVNAVVL